MLGACMGVGTYVGADNGIGRSVDGGVSKAVGLGADEGMGAGP